MKISKRESCLQTIIPTCCPKHPLLASQSKSAVVKMSCFVGRLLEEIASRPMVLHHRRRVHCKCTHNIANVSPRNVKVVNMDHAKLYFTILNYTLFVLHCFPCLCTCSWKKNSVSPVKKTFNLIDFEQNSDSDSVNNTMFIFSNIFNFSSINIRNSSMTLLA